MSTTEKRPTFAAVPLMGIAKPRILSADIGGSWTRVTQIDHVSLQPARIVSIATPATHDEIINRVGNIGADLLDGKRPDAVGIAIAGQVNDLGRITKAGPLSTRGCVDRNIKKDISEMTGVSPDNVAGLNDVQAAAYAERKARLSQLDIGGCEAIFTLSTGFGGARYNDQYITPDEPGHVFYEDGVSCGCGANGCLEAHISGSGIEKKYGIRGEYMSAVDPRWQEVAGNLVAGMDMTLDRYEADGQGLPTRLAFLGSVITKGPGLMDALREGLTSIREEQAPEVVFAEYGENSGLYGGYFAAYQILQ